jgi:hypothetical protein
MKVEKPVDLGKLQDTLIKAKSDLANARRVQESAYTKLASAQRAYDAAKKKCGVAYGVLATARENVLEAARTVANG